MALTLTPKTNRTAPCAPRRTVKQRGLLALMASLLTLSVLSAQAIQLQQPAGGAQPESGARRAA